MTKNLLITAGVALVCGVIGAMGFERFFGPKSEGSSSNHSQGKSGSGSKKESGSNEKSAGGESKESGKESNAQASTANSIPGVSSAKDADMLKQQIRDLSQRVNHLRESVDSVTRPSDETPPVLRMMQIKMSELAHEMAEVAVLPAAYRRYDNRLETLKEELKTLRARIEPAHADSIGGRIPGRPVLLPTPAAGKDPFGRFITRGADLAAESVSRSNANPGYSYAGSDFLDPNSHFESSKFRLPRNDQEYEL